MSKGKYKVNPHTLELEKVQLGGKQLLLKLGTHIAFSVIILILAYSFFSSPNELMQSREIEQYELQLDLLSEKVDQLSSVLTDIEERDDNIYRVIFEAEPVPVEKRMAGIGGSERYSELKGYENSDRIIETKKKIDQLSRKLYVQSKSFDEVHELAKNKAEMLAAIPGIQPVSNKELKRIASGFGMRIHPIYKTLRMHEGIDFSAPIGTPIYATGNGKIKNQRGFGMSGYGKAVIIDHGYGYETLYAHMSKILVKAGQKVKRGEIIGYVGNTGRSKGPHLHYEVRKNGKPINPIHYFYHDLTPEEYEKVIEIASRPTQSMS